MTFTGNEDHEITLTAASAMTKNYRDTISTGDTIAHYLGRDAIEGILDQSDCVGIRIYYGLDSEGVKQLIFVGVLANGNDIYTGQLAERTIRCPQECSSANPLNSNVTT